jgi:hypothetical protein
VEAGPQESTAKDREQQKFNCLGSPPPQMIFLAKRQENKKAVIFFISKDTG